MTCAEAIAPDVGLIASTVRGIKQLLADQGLDGRPVVSSARNYAAARLMADTGLRINEARHLALDDIRWELGRFGKLHVRLGKGAQGSGPRQQMVPLNDAGRTLRWYIEDVGPVRRWSHPPWRAAVAGGADQRRRDPEPGRLRPAAGWAGGRTAHLPAWKDRMSPRVLRHYYAAANRGIWKASEQNIRQRAAVGDWAAEVARRTRETGRLI